MPNFLDFLRMRNIYGPQVGNDLPSQGGFTGTMEPPGPLMGTGQNPWDNIDFGGGGPIAPQPMPQPTPAPQPQGLPNLEDMYNPNTEATDRYNEMLKTYPTREQYKPSALRRIGGALMAVASGFGHKGGGYQYNPAGVQGGLNFLDEKFDKAQEDWKTQVLPLERAAQLERYENINKRQIATSQRAQDIKNENDKARLQIQDYKAKGAKFDFKGPTVMAAYPDGRVENTGIPTGHLSDSDKIQANSEARIANTVAAGEQARQTEGVKQEGRRELAAYGVPYVMRMADGSTRLVQMTKEGGFEEVDLPPGAEVEKVGAPGKSKQADSNQMELIKNQAAEGLAEIDKLVDAQTGKLTNMGGWTGGWSGIATGMIPTTEAYKGKASIGRIKSILTLGIIQAMKEASKTGATGFGQLNLRELGVLQSAADKLDPAMGEDAMLEELKRIQEKLKMIMQPTDGFEDSTVKKPESPADIIARIRGGKNAPTATR